MLNDDEWWQLSKLPGDYTEPSLESMYAGLDSLERLQKMRGRSQTMDRGNDTAVAALAAAAAVATAAVTTAAELTPRTTGTAAPKARPIEAAGEAAALAPDELADLGIMEAEPAPAEPENLADLGIVEDEEDLAAAGVIDADPLAPLDGELDECWWEPEWVPKWTCAKCRMQNAALSTTWHNDQKMREENNKVRTNPGKRTSESQTAIPHLSLVEWLPGPLNLHHTCLWKLALEVPLAMKKWLQPGASHNFPPETAWKWCLVSWKMSCALGQALFYIAWPLVVKCCDCQLPIYLRSRLRGPNGSRLDSHCVAVCSLEAQIPHCPHTVPHWNQQTDHKDQLKTTMLYGSLYYSIYNFMAYDIKSMPIIGPEP